MSPKKEERKTRECEMVPVPNLIKLVEKVGTADEVAAMIGCSGSHVARMTRENQGRRSFDLAAEAILMKKFPDKKGNQNKMLALVRIDTTHLTTIQTLVENLGGSLAAVKD